MHQVAKKNLINSGAYFLEKARVKKQVYDILISIAQYRALGLLRKIDKNVEHIQASNPKNIVFHCVHSCFVSSIFKEVAIAKTLQLMGHNVTMIICGGKLHNCTGMFNVNVPPNKSMCKNCIRFGIELFNIFDLPYMTYNTLIDDDFETIKVGVSNAKLKKYFGVDIDYHARASTARYFKGEKLFDEEIYNQKLTNAVITTTFAKLYNDIYKPDIVVTSHSCYSEWGAFSDYFRNKGVKVYTWYTGYNHRTLIFDLITIDKNFNRYKKHRENKLSDEEKIQLYNYIDERKKGVDDTSQYHFVKKATYICNTGKFEKTYVLYPNLSWDVDPTSTSNFFDTIFEWVETTIKLFEKFPEYQLIIKTHPAEKLYRSKYTVYDFVMSKFTKLPQNVFIVNPNENISPYELFRYTDVGIVSNGTVGLEMVLDNIPIIVTGNAHYKNKGFTYDAESINDYINLLFYNDDVKKGIVKNKDERDLYSYYYFIKSFIPFTILRHRNFLDIGFNAKSYNDFLNDYELSHIATSIVNNKIMQNW